MVEIKRRIRLTDNKKKKTIKGKKGINPNNPKGRPEVYSEKIGAYIIKELMSGRTLTKICKDSKVPSIPTIYTWLNPLHPNHKSEFLKSYREAREVQAEVWADETRDIAADNKNDNNVKVARDKLRIDSNKWLAAHLLPKKFSDRVQLTGADGKDLIPAAPTTVIYKLVKPE